MPLIRIERRTRLPAEEAWHRLTTWENHARHVPFTAITVTTAPPTGVGTRFTARTGTGRAGFDDPMEVVHWEPPTADRPGRCRVEKRGRVVLGWAEAEVVPADVGSLAVWREEVRVRGLPRLLDPPTAWAARLLFGRVVTGLLEGR
ncbi:SRPBCC family protein [Streptomyces verrucosisporus]|uniref:SRPBCC family protein n=1 Tax=Streptomyces verrucosisporus TaxID=1695161 RepID=UPI0019D17D3C|nr:SRPBCC family protein [Streptomyces verrucosisporus]MBN3932227.1 SRPBCC family protein [Streptomyces verrucosisporus]